MSPYHTLISLPGVSEMEVKQSVHCLSEVDFQDGQTVTYVWLKNSQKFPEKLEVCRDAAMLMVTAVFSHGH